MNGAVANVNASAPLVPYTVTAEPLTAVASGLLICMEHFSQWRRWLQSSEEDV